MEYGITTGQFAAPSKEVVDVSNVVNVAPSLLVLIFHSVFSILPINNNNGTPVCAIT